MIHDALFFPGNAIEKPFLADVLTVHHANYYQGKGRANDYESPNPVGFLSVRPGTEFLLAVELAPGEKAEYDPWVDFAHKMLIEALGDWGIGSKTAAGYGRLEKIGHHGRSEKPADEKREELADWLRANIVTLWNLLRAPDGGTTRVIEKIMEFHGPSLREARGDVLKQRLQVIKSFVKNDLRSGQQQTSRRERDALGQALDNAFPVGQPHPTS